MNTSMLAPELYEQIRRLEIRARRLAAEDLGGRFESAYRGRGMEFVELALYQPGDSVRQIDWNVTARTGLPHVRRLREEREQAVFLLVDLSASGDAGSVRAKRDLGIEVAACLAASATSNQDPVGLVAFSDRVDLFLPPRRGRGQLWRLVRALLAQPRPRPGTDLAGALDYLSRVARRPSLVFVLSDFLAEGYAERLARVAARHDVTALVLEDRLDRALPPVGLLCLQDPETGTTGWVDSSAATTRKTLAARASARAARRTALLREAGVDELVLATDRPYLEPLARFFAARERRRAR
jgi:uncharacterized protein (DUF58 family)